MTKRHMKNEKCYNTHSCPLWELEIGGSLQIQNQDSPYPYRWAKTGRVVEALGNRQYHIHIDGSNWAAWHNHCFLWKINPVVNTP